MTPNLPLTAVKIGGVLFAATKLKNPHTLHVAHGIYHGHATDHLLVDAAGDAFFLPHYAYVAVAVASPADDAAVQAYAAETHLN